METGISVYPGLGGTIQEKTARIERAAALGMTRLFTSFHIPETDPAAFRKELQAVLETARQFQFDIVADVSPASAAFLGMDRFDPEAIAKLGITTVRFDDGFDAAKLAMYSHLVRVQVNASTLRQSDLEDLQKTEPKWITSTACTTSIPVLTRAWTWIISRPKPTCSTPMACPSVPSYPARPANGRRSMRACRHWKTTAIRMSAWLHAIWRP